MWNHNEAVQSQSVMLILCFECFCTCRFTLEDIVQHAIWSKCIKMTLYVSSCFLSRMNSLWLWIMHSQKKRWTIRTECDTYSLTHLFRCSQEDTGSHWANVTWENLSRNWLSLCMTSPECSTSFTSVKVLPYSYTFFKHTIIEKKIWIHVHLLFCDHFVQGGKTLC